MKDIYLNHTVARIYVKSKPNTNKVTKLGA